MKLISCHIDGFGKLCDTSFSFDSGLNTFLQENGWGKSTLAAFLRVMLYGFMGEGKRNDLENERKKYQPWTKHTYGGSLTFSVEDKEYTVYRVFGSKAKDDSFSLIDMSTNLPSKDYTENLGEELFRIDQASFMRTAFTDQQDVATEGTDSIYAKLSNLCEDTDDLNNYETVREYLNKALNNMSPHRATGSINGLNKEIAGLKVDTALKEQTEQAAEELTLRIRDRKNSGMAFVTELNQLKETEVELIRRESRKAVLEKKKELTLEKEQRTAVYRQARAAVPGDLPVPEAIETAKAQLRHLNNMELQLAEKKVDPHEMQRLEAMDMIFSQGFPEDEELRGMDNRAADYNKAGKQLEELQSEVAVLKEKYTKDMHAMGVRLNRIHLRRVYGLLIVLVIALVEVVLAMNKSSFDIGIFPVLAGGALGLGILGLIIFFIVIEVSYKRASVMPSSELRDQKEGEIRALRDFMDKERRDMDAFFTKYGHPCEPAAYSMVIANIFHDKNEYLALSDKVRFAEKSGILVEKRKAEEWLDGFLGDSRMERSGDYANDLQHLTIVCNNIRNAETEMKNAEDKLAVFLDEHPGYEDYIEDKEAPGEYSLTEIREKIRGIETNLQENEKLLRQDEKRREDLMEQLDEQSAKEEELNEKLEKVEALKAKYKNYERTLNFLQKAHDELNARMIAPLSDSFRGHLEEMGYSLSGKEPDKIYIDSHAVVTIEEAGDRRDLGFFSTGIKDLVGLAMRVAMLDNMYEYEKPFVILDDPFVNLDSTKISVAKGFLDKLSEDYQVLYFTCRDRFV